mmetsp:Transcript_2684/g.3892  ORF Transcript_2684/g.3892 Transcript_2684/m.3892 type:complete len:106 (-) Transcript_2684:57-374(-)|eukprot:CAMPEP_0194276300 /NCGR_PEP_ID=MMETSP0169-20130528/8925_1 /TAXON_ID=218684 /ORGANISM="Corethron pennatum, Strain L29A3" /LENGTH=105 /DNA_ID=CAMNT_0039019989 /DNA_START=69 /DNA_END=386 /DNA_ORIENTATION=+
MKRNAPAIKLRSAILETSRINPAGSRPVPPNFIITTLPSNPLKMIFRALPASSGFIALICRRFRDLYRNTAKGKKEKHATFKYSIVSKAAFWLYLEEHEGKYKYR